MKVTIYQIVPELDNDHMMFRDFRNLCIACGGELPAECYEAVYTGEVNAVTLEDVYRIFNIEHPKGFRGHSLSPSDVVEIYDFAEESSFRKSKTTIMSSVKSFAAEIFPLCF